MQTYCVEVFNLPITGATTVYTGPEFNGILASAEKMFGHARLSQISGGSVSITVTIERSNDGVNFESGVATLLTKSNLSTTAIENAYGEFNATKVLGCAVRLAITLAGTSPSANIQLIVSGHES